MPDAEEDEPEDDFDEDIVEDTESEDEYSGEEERASTSKLNIVEVNSDHSPAPVRTPHNKYKPSNNTPRSRVKVPIHITRGGGVSAKAVAASPLRTRGIADFTKVGGQEVRLKDLFGPRNEDLKAILLTRDYWAKQEALPLRKPGSLSRSFFESTEAREKAISTTTDWYTDTGREAFMNGQKCKDLSPDEAAVYLANDGEESLNVLCGPINHPQVYTLEKQKFLNVAEPFQSKKNRRGWLFNLGSRIQDAQWAASEKSHIQYLAVAVEQRGPDGPHTRSMDNPDAPAFSATKPFPASIQIWAFDADKHGQLDVSKQPRLQLVVCTDWGAPKHIRWCPISTSDCLDTEGQESSHVGLLAGIWSDGRVRILDISYEDSTKTQYLHVSHAAFDVAFPQTVPSCLQWLSGTTLAVATAMGTLAIWTLSQPDTFSAPRGSQFLPKPWFYQQISETYILTLSSGWPSQPHFVSITTADGFGRLYDIRTPNADTTASIRGRTLGIAQDWHEHTQSFIGPDEHYMLKHNPIRRYYHNLYSMRGESSIVRCATSPVHPGILIGGADGKVEASNPIGRITNYKLIPWQQTWFAHEWRRPVKDLVTKAPRGDVEMNEADLVQEATVSGEADSTIPQKFLDQPLVRITEGYKALQPGIQHSVVSKKVANPEIGKGITIYEEASGVTVLAWNPNLRCGTWAVAGMGSGSLRVEDVGV
jgi:transcription factor C subunit 6